MTAFLCTMAVLALLIAVNARITGTNRVAGVVATLALYVLLPLGFAALALVSYLS